jgi:FtsP/CotA-like multicopper oxidase with cupredoxin domain
MHFHGIRMLNNNMNDGVPSITQCPIAPGQSMSYTWVASNYGTSWYHSHYQLQAYMGMAAPMVIDGPTTMTYDEDLGTIFLQDWSHHTVEEMYNVSSQRFP